MVRYLQLWEEVLGASEQQLCHEKCGPGWGGRHLPHPCMKSKSNLIVLPRTANLAAPKESMLGMARGFFSTVVVIRLLLGAVWEAAVGPWGPGEEGQRKCSIVPTANRTFWTRGKHLDL